MIQIIKSFYGMFLGRDGNMSSTKLLAFAGYTTFLILSVLTAIYLPCKFNYELFAVLSAASGSSIKIADKWLNIKSGGKSE